MPWLTSKWNQKSSPRVTGAVLEEQCNADEQMQASKPCHLGRTADDGVGRGQGLLPLTNSAEQNGKTMLWSSWSLVKRGWRPYHLSQSVLVCFGKAVLWSANTCWSHRSQESELWTRSDCGKAHVDKQAGEIRGTGLTVLVWRRNGVSQPVAGASSLGSSPQSV